MNLVSQSYTCQFCGHKFSKESTLAVHVCEQKRRHLSKNEKHVQMGLMTYQKFYEIAQKGKSQKTFDEFASSPYYTAFVKFGRYCVSTKVINPKQFLEWLLKHNKKLDYWAGDKMYTEYLLDYLKVEAVSDALARAVEYSIDWSEKHSAPAQDCLRYGNTNTVCYAITTGRISPWVIYNSDSGQKFLSELNSEQVAMIWPYIDSDVWQKKFADYAADAEYAREILRQAGW